MHIIFSEEEKNYINMIPFKWEIKKDCPKEIKKTIENKFELLEKENNV